MLGVIGSFAAKLNRSGKPVRNYDKIIAVLPELNPQVVAGSRLQFHRQIRLARDAKKLTDLGFQHCGVLQHTQAFQITNLGLWQHQNGVNVVISEAVEAGLAQPNYSIDIIIAYKNGTSFTLSSCAQPQRFARAAKHKIEYLPNAPLSDLLGQLKPLLNKPISVVPLAAYVEESIVQAALYCWRPEALASKQFNAYMAKFNEQVDEHAAIEIAKIGEQRCQQIHAQRILAELGLNEHEHICVHKYSPRPWVEKVLAELGAAPNLLRSTMATLQDLPVYQMLGQAALSMGLQGQMELVTEVDDARVYRLRKPLMAS